MRPRSLSVLFTLGAVLILLLPSEGAATVPAVREGLGPSVLPSAAVLLTDGAIPPSGVATSPLSAAAPVHLLFTLASRDPGGLSHALSAVSNPTGPTYRHFLSSSEFDQRFGPTASARATLERVLAQSGATGVSPTADGGAVSATLGVGHAEQLLGVRFVEYALGSNSVYTTQGSPALPSVLIPIVQSVHGLTGRLPGAPGVAGRSALPGVGQFVIDGATNTKLYIGSDFTQAYGEPGLFPPGSFPNASFATRSAVATILMSGFNQTTGTDLPPFDPRAVNQYFNDTFPSAWPHPNVSGVPVSANGVTPPAPGSLLGGTDSTFNQVENSLDLEMAGSASPGARLVNFYFAASLFQSGSQASLIASADLFATALSASLSYNYSPFTLTAVSNSYGLPDLNDTLWNNELAKAQMMGVTVLAASGDQGNAPTPATGRFQGQWPTWPGSASFEQFGSVAVGGTSIDLAGAGTGTYTPGNLPVSFEPGLGAPASEVTWWNDYGGYGNLTGSEGGASLVYKEPSWQHNSSAQWPIVNATVIQGLPVLDRAEPDVAFVANATIVYVSRLSTGVDFVIVQGTSIASPLMAGFVAEWSSVSGHQFGYLDPELYHMGSYFGQTGLPGTPYRDVEQGSNYLFTAGRGWDATTGWGSLNVTTFLALDGNQTIRNFVYTGPTPGLPTSSGGGPFAVSTTLLLAIGIGLTVAAAVVLILGRPRTPRAPAVPTGAVVPGPSAGPAGTNPPPPGSAATFSCPYCGAERPAEPVRCPACGTW